MPSSISLPLWISAIGVASKIVLIVLAGLSVWSVSVILDRRKLLQQLTVRKGEWEQLEVAVRNRTLATYLSRSVLPTDLLRVLRSLCESQQRADSIESGFQASIKITKLGWTKGLSVLATLGSNAPFIGLFGTVLGIIQAFGTLSGARGDMDQVIFSLAEALVATAVGLFVAIPAVVAYNYFQNQLRQSVVKLEALKDLYCSRL